MGELGLDNVKLAVYIERLDTFISNQDKVNTSLAKSNEDNSREIKELRDWKNKLLGGKIALWIVGSVLMNTILAIGAVGGIIIYFMG